MNDAERLEDMICDLRRENAELMYQVEQLVSAWKDAQEKIADLTHKIDCMTEEQFDPMRDGWVGKDGLP